MWRVYNSDVSTNIFFPSLKIQKGDKIILDVEYTKNKNTYYVTYCRSKNQEPIKFEVVTSTWDKLANNSTPQ